jgi:hypothetical protein
MSDLGGEVAQNYDNSVATQMRNMEIFKYYKAMGGSMGLEEGTQAGWSPENIQMFNQLLDEDAPKRQGIVKGMEQDLNAAGMNTTRENDTSGKDVLTIGGRK